MQESIKDKLGKLSLNDLALMSDMYHKGKKLQKEIEVYFKEKNIKISQSEISKYLKLSEEIGIVNININSTFNENFKIKLKERFKHLQEIIIVPYTHIAGNGIDQLLLKNLGMACAQYFLIEVDDGAKIGVSSGNAIKEFIDALEELCKQRESKPYECIIRPLSSKMSFDLTPSTQVALIAKLLDFLPRALGKACQLPSIVLEKNIEEQMNFYREHPLHYRTHF